MHLRGYQPGDLRTLCTLDAECFAPPFQFSAAAMRRFVEHRAALVQVATAGPEDTGILGFSIVHLQKSGPGRIGYVLTLDVRPFARRQGVATALMRAQEESCGRQGAHHMYLHVYAENREAIALYERLGYLFTRVAENFYARGMDALVYRKPLGNSKGSAL